MLNSFIVATSVTLIALLLHAMAGYALARLNFPGRNVIFVGIISTLMIPFYTILIPLSLLVKEFGVVQHLPRADRPGHSARFRDLLAAAVLPGHPVRSRRRRAHRRGVSRGRVLPIALPLARPVLAALAVFFFLANWDRSSGR